MQESLISKNSTYTTGSHQEEVNKEGESWLKHITKAEGDVEYDPPQRITTEDVMSVIQEQKEAGIFATRNWIIEKGDIKNSILTFLTASVGAGILAFPKIYACFGVFFGILYTILFAYFNYVTYEIIDRAIEDSKKKGYGNLCRYYLGASIAKISSLGIMSVLFVVSCVYASISWTILEQLLVDYSIAELSVENADKNTYKEYDLKTYMVRLVSMSIIAACCFPLMLFRKLAVLRYLTAAIMLVMAYIVILAIVQAPFFISHNKDRSDYEIKLFEQDFGNEWISSIGAISMSFSCQPIYIYIRAGILHKSKSRTRKVYAWGLFLEVLLYGLFGLAGYYSLGGKLVPDMFTNRKPIKHDDKDIAMKIARVILFPLIVLHVLLPFITLRESIIQYFRLGQSKRAFVLLTFSLCIFIFALPVVYPDVFSLIGIFGGLFSGFFSSGIFLLIGYRLSKSVIWKAIYIFMMLILAASAFANTFVSISSIASQ